MPPAQPAGRTDDGAFDLGYTDFQVFARLTAARVTFITRAKSNLAYTVERPLHRSANVHDLLVWIGSGSDRQLVRLVQDRNLYFFDQTAQRGQTVAGHESQKPFKAYTVLFIIPGLPHKNVTRTLPKALQKAPAPGGSRGLSWSGTSRGKVSSSIDGGLAEKSVSRDASP